MQWTRPSEADRAAWNDFVGSSRNGHILQSWEWGEVKGRTGWKPLRLALEEGSSYQATALMLLRSLPYGAGTIAYVPKGPVLDYENGNLLRETIGELKRVASANGAISMKIEPDLLEHSELRESFLRLGLEPSEPVQMRSSIWVDLTVAEDEMLARQKQKTRYNTRLAAKKGVSVTSASLAELPDWHQMFQTTAKRDGFSIHGLEYYKIVLEILGGQDFARLFVAHHEGDLLAGIVVFRFGEKAQYMYGASSDHKRNLMAPYLLQWEAMRWAKAQGAKVYDLWGIPDRLEDTEDLWGVYRHKRGYGGEIVRYVGAYDLVLSRLRHLALERVARPAFKRLARATA